MDLVKSRDRYKMVLPFLTLQCRAAAQLTAICSTITGCGALATVSLAEQGVGHTERENRALADHPGQSRQAGIGPSSSGQDEEREEQPEPRPEP